MGFVVCSIDISWFDKIENPPLQPHIPLSPCNIAVYSFTVLFGTVDAIDYDKGGLTDVVLTIIDVIFTNYVSNITGVPTSFLLAADLS